MRLLLKALTGAVLLLTITSPACFAQSPLARTLLWRISGNNLRQPSYLFGTMHLTDKRLFNMDDSVYHSIENTSGLAIEVNPDDMAAEMILRELDKVQGKKLKEMLPGKDFKRYSTALAKKFHKPADEITTHDIVRQKNKWMERYMKKGEMPTFLDAYLYSIGRRQGKWVGGIEDISDQANLEDELVDQSDIQNVIGDHEEEGNKIIDTETEKMIQLYLSQDINGIDNFTNANSSQLAKDRLLIHRNIKMARRIDSLTALRSMFCAVGAAHLAGDSGVIQLLRARGFTVEPVLCKSKTVATAYRFPEVHPSWIAVEDPNKFYTASMPGNATSYKLLASVDMKFYVDITSLSGYYTMSAVRAAAADETEDTLFARVARGMFAGKKYQLVKKLHKNGIPGREYLTTIEGLDAHMQVFISQKYIVVACAYAFKKSPGQLTAFNQFFESVALNNKQDNNVQYYPFVDSVMGVSLVSSAKLVYQKNMSRVDAGWNISCFAGVDVPNSAYIFVFSHDMTRGNYLVSDSLIYKDLTDRFSKLYDNLQETRTDAPLSSTRVFTGNLASQKGALIKVQASVHHNRKILVMATADSIHMQSAAIDSLFKSVQFFDKPAEWKTRTAPDSSYTISAPSALTLYDASRTLSSTAQAFDTATATTYLIVPETLSKYYWIKSDSAFWNSLSGRNDHAVMIRDSAINNGRQQGRDYIFKAAGAENVYFRSRVVLQGNKLYRLFVTGEKEFLQSPDNNRFFESFTLTHPDSARSLLQPKTGILLADLHSADSATRSEAFTALETAPFDSADFTALTTAVLQNYRSPYSDDTATFINKRLTDKLAALKHPAVIDFVRVQYPALAQTDTVKANELLGILTQTPTTQSYTTLFSLMLQHPPGQELHYWQLQGLGDSLALTRQYLDAIVQLAADSINGPSMAGLLVQLADSGYLGLDSLRLYQQQVLTGAGRQLAFLKDTLQQAYSNGAYEEIRLLEKLHTAAGVDMLQRYLGIANPYLRKQATIALITNGQQVAPSVLVSLAANPATRITLYDNLKELKKTALYPHQYQTQAAFAQAELYNYLHDDDDEEEEMPSPLKNEDIKLAGQKQAMFKGKPYLFYFFRVKLDDGVHTGIAGGYNPNGTSLKREKYLVYLDWKGTYNAANFSAELKKYLKEMEEEKQSDPDADE